MYWSKKSENPSSRLKHRQRTKYPSGFVTAINNMGNSQQRALLSTVKAISTTAVFAYIYFSDVMQHTPFPLFILHNQEQYRVLFFIPCKHTAINMPFVRYIAGSRGEPGKVFSTAKSARKYKQPVHTESCISPFSCDEETSGRRSFQGLRCFQGCRVMKICSNALYSPATQRFRGFYSQNA